MRGLGGQRTCYETAGMETSHHFNIVPDIGMFLTDKLAFLCHRKEPLLSFTPNDHIPTIKPRLLG